MTSIGLGSIENLILIVLLVLDLLAFSNRLCTTCMTPLACCIMATSGLSCISKAPSWRQSTGCMSSLVNERIDAYAKEKKKYIIHHTSVTINNENDLSDSDVAAC